MPSFLSTFIARLAGQIDRRLRDLYPMLLCGLLLTRERRRTCTSWFRAGRIERDFQRGYRTVAAAGRNSAATATTVLYGITDSPALAEQDRIKLTLDDTPTQRYGPKVEGAGLHHNPTPGPANQPFLHGHVFVTLAVAVDHPQWGAISLPVRSELYVRRKDVPKLPPERNWTFRTKVEQAVELIEWAANRLQHLGKPIWLAVDGGYANRAVIQAAKDKGVVLVGRLRKDARLWSEPEPRPAGKRGREAIYGKDAVSLARRAGRRGGWQVEEMVLYGKRVTKTYKTFVATWRPAGGRVRVVVVKEDDGWFAFFCTEVAATAAEVLGMVADRNSLEQTFKDVKEVWGGGQQQVRKVDASLGAWHLNLWAYTMVELWAWEEPADELVDRSNSPWDSEDRRPSHNDRRKALLRRTLQEEFQEVRSGPEANRKLLEFAEKLIGLAA
jgi:hypothetical protein